MSPLSNIRLCVVSPLYHPSLGGVGRQAQLLTERLAKKGVKVFVIARRMKGRLPAVFSKKVRIYKVWSIKPYLINFEKVTPLNILISLTFSISCASLLLWKRKDYDIVHFHGASLPLFISLPLLKILRKKIIAKVAAANIGTEAGSLRGRYLGLGNLIIRLLKMIDAFVAMTFEIETGLLNDGFSPAKINRITNFIDTSAFKPISLDNKNDLKKRRGFKNDKIVTFSGRFVQRKGIIFLLEAWKDIIKDFPEAKLVLLGDGPLLADMKSVATEIGITHSVDFLGHVNEVEAFLHATDVFVLASLQEGMPNSLLEAMACRLPVVATKIGGVVDIIKDSENGILVQPGDSQSLVAGFKKLLRNEKLAAAISKNAYKTIKDHYGLNSISQKYIDLYKKIGGP